MINLPRLEYNIWTFDVILLCPWIALLETLVLLLTDFLTDTADMRSWSSTTGFFQSELSTPIVLENQSWQQLAESQHPKQSPVEAEAKHGRSEATATAEIHEVAG
jgi:hypothetical protein